MRKIICKAVVGTPPEKKSIGDRGQYTYSFRVVTRSRFQKTETTSQDDPDAVWMSVSLYGDRWDRLVPHIEKRAKILIIGDLKAYGKKDGSVGFEIRAENIEFLGGGDFHRGSSKINPSTDIPF